MGPQDPYRLEESVELLQQALRKPCPHNRNIPRELHKLRHAVNRLWLQKGEWAVGVKRREDLVVKALY